jgi:hypothetical protein
MAQLGVVIQAMVVGLGVKADRDRVVLLVAAVEALGVMQVLAVKADTQ